MSARRRSLTTYSVRARNTSVESENKIHDDAVASSLGFRGGLVPGVTIYGYITTPLVREFPAWLERGSMKVRFIQPFYEGNEVIVRGNVEEETGAIKLAFEAARIDGTVCARAEAVIEEDESRVGPSDSDCPYRSIPAAGDRPAASRETLVPGSILGTLVETIDTDAIEKRFLDGIEESPVYRGPRATAHPAYLLGLSNEVLLRNFKLGPWIHTASYVTNLSIAHAGDEITAKARIAAYYERKGHEFVELDVSLSASGRPIQQVHHVAIVRPRGTPLSAR